MKKEKNHKLYRKMGFYERYIKRAIDIFCSGLAIIVFCWLYAIIALLVRIKLGSPVLFTQYRPGLIDPKTGKERIFKMYKFRTMTDKKDAEGNLLPDEVRLTKFGAWLRSTSLDELPEAFCILNGDMSLVGTRPPTLDEWEKYELHHRARLTFDNNYFNALYQGIPVGGYTKMVENLLEGIEVRLNEDYLTKKQEYDQLAEKVVYTGAIDAYFDYCLGNLEYRSVRFENEVLDIPNFQGNAAVNYTDRETPWTRIIEHKWFEFGKNEDGNDLPKTVISREYSSEWKPGDEPYYPVNDEKNSNLYREYRKLTDAEKKVIFGGRLGEYKYYDMDQVIAAALERCEDELG